MKQPTCFFCYAWGTQQRYYYLEFIRKSILEKTNDRISVILDRRTYEDNEDFDILRERISSYDLVIVFATKDFKQIIIDPQSDRNKDREVLKEWDIIIEKYKKDANTVFPVVLEGDKESSLPDIFSNKNVRLFELFYKSQDPKHKGFFIPDAKQPEYKVFINNIVRTVFHNYNNRSKEYETTQAAMDQLFGLTDTVVIPNSCLVKPDLYSQIRTQKCFFVAGRKGSGKSTFIHNFREMDREFFDEHYKLLIPLSAEAFQHENAYESLIAKHREDSKLIDTHTLLCLFWQVYFFLHCMVVIRAEIETGEIDPDDKRYTIFDNVTRKLMRLIGLGGRKKNGNSVNDARVPRSVFNAAIELIDDFFLTALKSVRDQELLLTSFVGKFSAQAIIESKFGVQNTKYFIDALAKCEKKIMISLDGFDTHSEDFRIITERMAPNSKEYASRTDYEIMFFRTLLEVVSQLKGHKIQDKIAAAIGDFSDYCIVLPKDRFDMIIYNDRDSFKKNFGTLSWSGMELMELATKRLEYLITTIDNTYRINTRLGPVDRMNAALKFFPGLPTSISMNVNGNVIRMSLFNYILRSSFWRPRDVISNLSKIMAMVVRVKDNNWESNKDSLSEDDIILSIKKNSEKIIDNEFIGEYRHVFRNLDEVLQELQNLDEQTEVHFFLDKLKGIKFDASFSYDLNQAENKLRVLYQLGVIGLLYNKKTASHQHYLNHVCFEFNEGMAPFDDLLKRKIESVTDVHVIFNPIFESKLMLKFNTKELIGNWSEDYMKSNHTNKESIHGM